MLRLLIIISMALNTACVTISTQDGPKHETVTNKKNLFDISKIRTHSSTITYKSIGNKMYQLEPTTNGTETQCVMHSYKYKCTDGTVYLQLGNQLKGSNGMMCNTRNNITTCSSTKISSQ